MSISRQLEDLPAGFTWLGNLATVKCRETHQLIIPQAARKLLEAKQAALEFAEPAARPIVKELASSAPSGIPPKPALKTPRPHASPGPNDLGIIDVSSPTLLADVKALTARVLTKRHLADLDAYSKKLCMELFVGASLRILTQNKYPLNWDEVLRYLDDTDPDWDSPRQIINDLGNTAYPFFAFDRQMSDFMGDMPRDSLSILLRRCRLVLRKAIDDATGKSGAGDTGLKPPHKPAVVPIFSLKALQHALGTIGKMEEKVRSQAQQSLNAAVVDDGCRALPDVRKAIGNLDRLTGDFENLAEPIGHLRTELALAGAMDPSEFRISPLLLLGEPGIGKTYLALQLAEALGVPMDKISAGAAQGGFQLTGSHPSWSRAMPGSVFTLLANGSSATPVLVIDEVDKIGGGGSYPIVPALLDLLETNTAKAFKDEFFDMPIDASRIVVVMTANEREAIPAPLLSRAALFTVPRPGAAQRRRIIEREVAGLARKTRKRIGLDEAAADNLASRIDLDLRQTRRAVVEAFSRALMDGEKVASPRIPAPGGRRQAGFVW